MIDRASSDILSLDAAARHAKVDLAGAGRREKVRTQMITAACGRDRVSTSPPHAIKHHAHDDVIDDSSRPRALDLTGYFDCIGWHVDRRRRANPDQSIHREFTTRAGDDREILARGRRAAREDVASGQLWFPTIDAVLAAIGYVLHCEFQKEVQSDASKTGNR